jgi:hypothetical protein
MNADEALAIMAYHAGVSPVAAVYAAGERAWPAAARGGDG